MTIMDIYADDSPALTCIGIMGQGTDDGGMRRRIESLRTLVGSDFERVPDIRRSGS
jgi:hypothetical protein